jgi:hypothetical protein
VLPSTLFRSFRGCILHHLHLAGHLLQIKHLGSLWFDWYAAFYDVQLVQGLHRRRHPHDSALLVCIDLRKWISWCLIPEQWTALAIAS